MPFFVFVVAAFPVVVVSADAVAVAVAGVAAVFLLLLPLPMPLLLVSALDEAVRNSVLKLRMAWISWSRFSATPRPNAFPAVQYRGKIHRT